MISLGVLLVILGVGSLILPNLGFQFRLMEIVDPYQPWAGVIVAAVGLITVLFGAQRRGRKAAEPAEASAAAAPAAVAAAPAAAPAAPPPVAPPPVAPPPAEPPPAASPAASTSPAWPDTAAAPPAAAPEAAPDAESRPWPTDPPERTDD
jgi:predicted lipid-binding transport protein (Tim44 family)